MTVRELQAELAKVDENAEVLIERRDQFYPYAGAVLVRKAFANRHSGGYTFPRGPEAVPVVFIEACK